MSDLQELKDALDLYDNPQFIIIQSASPELRTIIDAARLELRRLHAVIEGDTE